MNVEEQELSKKWTTATVLSCLVLPGTGQLMLGKKKIGIIFITLSVCLLLTLVFSIVRFFLWYFAHLTPEFEKFSELSTSLDYLLVPILTFVSLGILWIVNIIHIFRCKPH